LARALANRLGSQAFDTDDFYWLPTDPPFRTPRPVEERLRLMEELFLPRPDWVLSGSLHSWGAQVMGHVTHVVFLTLPQAARLARLRSRERRRFGDRIAPGGDLHAAHRGFLEWAMGYDEPQNPGRSLASHEAWLAKLPQPVIRLDAGPDAATLAEAVLDALTRAD
jgi:adenylate kinase family enzyme